MDLTLDDQRAASIALPPPGKLWDFEPGSNFWRLFDAMAETDLRIEQLGEQLLLEMDPATTYQLLDDWEAAYGLPDPDGPQNLSVSDRRAALIARITAIGGLTKQYLIDQAGALGYPGATIDEFEFATCETDCESFVIELPWKRTFLMTLPVATDGLGATCDGSCEDFLGQPFNSHIENYINRIKPAGTFAVFAYAG